MLVVIAKAKVGDGAVEAAKNAISAMVKASMAEEGCIEYAFTTDILDPTVLYIVEKWVDEAALVAHFQTPHMASFQAALAGHDVTISEALKYEAGEGQPLM